MNLIEYDSRYKDRIVDLLSLGMNAPRAYMSDVFDWMYLESPKGVSPMLLAIENDKVVGFFAMILKDISFNGNTYLGARDVNPVVHPNFRGRGIFSALLKESIKRYSHIDVNYNFANSLSKHGFIKNGWTESKYYSEFFSVKFSFELSRKNILAQSKRFKSNKSKPCEPFSCSFIKHEELYDINYSNLKYNHNIYIKKNFDYIKWRYLSAKNKNSSLYSFLRINFLDSKSYSIVILKKEKNNKHFFLVDLLNFTDYKAIEIINCILSSSKMLRINSISSFSTLFGKDEINYFGFFLRQVRYQGFYVRPNILKSIDFEITNCQNWFLPAGESEHF